MPRVLPESRFSPRDGLLAAASLAAVGLGLSGFYAVTGYGLACPWRSLTGTLCPFCGTTRLGSAVLHGDIAAAWASNQFVFVLLTGLGLACVAWVIELAGGPALRLRGRLRDQRLWYLVLGGVAVAFMIGRNLVR